MMSRSDLASLRRFARLLLREARASRISAALPALRRLHKAGVLPFARLSEAFARRDEVRLKHALRAIAVECDAVSWEALVADPSGIRAEHLVQLGFSSRARSAHLNEWFPNEQSAGARQAESGGRLVRFGTQAVLCSDELYASLRAEP
ncbi:MAG TPA: hypothetical protein VGD50_01680 [Candidatus Baltobacteraceae bacterium]